MGCKINACESNHLHSLYISKAAMTPELVNSLTS